MCQLVCHCIFCLQVLVCGGHLDLSQTTVHWLLTQQDRLAQYTATLHQSNPTLVAGSLQLEMTSHLPQQMHLMLAYIVDHSYTVTPLSDCQMVSHCLVLTRECIPVWFLMKMGYKLPFILAYIRMDMPVIKIKSKRNIMNFLRMY